MALTVTNVVGDLPGSGRLVAGTLTCDNSYPTGGYAITPAALGVTPGNQVTWMLIAGQRGVAGTVCFSARFDYPTQKLLIFNLTAGAQTANATDCSALVLDYIALVR